MASVATKIRRRTLLVGGIGLSAIVLVLVLAATAQGGLPWSSTTEVRVAFSDTGSLKVGDEVREFSSRIGNVQEVEFEDGRGVVTLALDGERAVYADATAEILDFSALAQKFVNLQLGTPGTGPLGEDAVIAEERTTPSQSLFDVLDVLDAPTRSALTSTFREVGGGLRERGGDLNELVGSAPELLDGVGRVSGALSAREANLPGLLRNTERVASRFVARRGDIDKLVDGFGTTAGALAVDSGAPLRDTLRKLPATLSRADDALTALRPPLGDTRQALADLRPGFAALGEATPDVRGVLREAPKPLDRVPGVAELAEPAIPDLTETVRDLRPLAPRVREGFGDLRPPLEVLAPYGPELGFLIVRLHSFVSENVAGDPNTHYARVNAGVGPSTVTGAALPNAGAPPRNAYPEPGEATFDRAGPGGNR